MHAHTPPFTKTAKQLYDETSIKAAAQDAKLDPISDVESKVRTSMQYLYHAQLLLKEAFPSRDQSQGTPAESAYLARAVQNELQADALRAIGIGDVAEAATTVATSQHPMAAEALRDEYEKTDKETGV